MFRYKFYCVKMSMALVMLLNGFLSNLFLCKFSLIYVKAIQTKAAAYDEKD